MSENREKKELPITLTEEQWHNIDYAIIKQKDKPPIAVSQEQWPIEDPSYKFDITFMTVKVTQQPNRPYPQIWYHIRIIDKRTGEETNHDFYEPTTEIRKYDALKKEMEIKNIMHRSKELKFHEPTTLSAKTSRTHLHTTIKYYYGKNLIRTTRHKTK